MAQLQANRIVRNSKEQLHSGDQMSRAEFHRIYEKMPEDFKAELIGGIVYVASPLRVEHGTAHPILSAVLVAYMAQTPGVQVAGNTTILLSGDSEPQPDLFLRILPEYGGQSRSSDDGYIQGPPELIAEIAYSTNAIDLHAKRRDYMRCGVLEYLVWSLKEPQLKWFDLRADKELIADTDGICRIHTFPGLWIDAQGLLLCDHQRLMAALQQGLQSAEHAQFVKHLAAQRK